MEEENKIKARVGDEKPLYIYFKKLKILVHILGEAKKHAGFRIELDVPIVYSTRFHFSSIRREYPPRSRGSVSLVSPFLWRGQLGSFAKGI